MNKYIVVAIDLSPIQTSSQSTHWVYTTSLTRYVHEEIAADYYTTINGVLSLYGVEGDEIASYADGVWKSIHKIDLVEIVEDNNSE